MMPSVFVVISDCYRQTLGSTGNVADVLQQFLVRNVPPLQADSERHDRTPSDALGAE